MTSVLAACGPRARTIRAGGSSCVRLSAGALEAVFVPGAGMIGTSLRHEGEELLHRGEGLTAYRERGALMGMPLLHPWANRLSADTYALHGRDVRLPPGAARRDEHGLPIHGLVGAHPGWRVTALGHDERSATVRARLRFSADPRLAAAFPFHHEVGVEAVLRAEGLTVATTVRATGGAPVPLAFGWHPYLRLPGARRQDWAISLPRRRHLELDERGLPTGRCERRAPARERLGDRHFDDAFDGIATGAAFAASAGGRTVSVRHDAGYPVAQVFSPAGAPFICFEPMTAPVDALRSGAGLRRVTSGRRFTAVFTVRVRASA